MSFSRKKDSAFAALSPKSKFGRFVDVCQTAVKTITMLGVAIGLCLHGYGYLKAQASILPRISALETKAAAVQAQLALLDKSYLDKQYVPRAEADYRRSERDKQEAARDERLERLEDSLYKIQTALTTIATQSTRPTR